MSYEELKQKNDLLQSQIDLLKSEIKKNDNDYISEHREFKNGEKVCYRYGDKWSDCFITSAFIDGNKIKYTANKAKKDGTQSVHDEYRLRYANEIKPFPLILI